MMYTEDYILLAAKVAHSVAQSVKYAFNKDTLPQWEFTSPLYQAKMIEHVKKILYNGTEANKIHNRWVHFALKEGWVVGPKDNDNKSHPHLVPFDELPVEIKLELKQVRAAVMPFRKNLGPGYHK